VTRGGIAALAMISAIAACDRELVPSPRARHDARDATDARRLEAQLAAVPGVARASVVVHRPFVDPLAPAPAAAPVASASILVVDARGTDADRLAATARSLATAALPDVSPASLSIVVAPPAALPAETAHVGPFEVAAGSRTALRATLAIGLLVIAALAAYIAYRQRRGTRPHQSSASTTRGS
jgi:type III secretory pathway lipoprotein EscJ